MRIANENFKKIRKKLNYTQNEFDKILELTKQRSNSIENNRSHIDDEVLRKLKEKFNVNPMFVLFGEGEIFLNKNNEEHKEANKKIINGDNAMINVNSGHNIKSYGNKIINKENLKNSNDNRINELINMYEHLPPKDQEIIYYEVKLKALKAES